METLDPKDVQEDIDKHKAIAAIAEQEGGKILIEGLKASIAGDVETILSLFRGEEMNLRCAVAKLHADLSLYRILKRAPEYAKIAEGALEKLLQAEVE